METALEVHQAPDLKEGKSINLLLVSIRWHVLKKWGMYVNFTSLLQSVLLILTELAQPMFLQPNQYIEVKDESHFIVWSTNGHAMCKNKCSQDRFLCKTSDSKVHGANMGPIWDR